MKDIAIYGAGGFGREVASMIINQINKADPIAWNLIGFFDDGEPKGKTISHFGKILGNYEDVNSWTTELCIVLCIGSPKILKLVKERIKNPNIKFPNIIHPNFVITDASTFNIGEGNIIKADCSVTCDVTIGNFNVFNGFINIGHDVTIGDFNVFMPGCRISGEVSIYTLNLIGADSFIKQQLKVGEGVTLSPLSALLTKPKDNSLYIGNPASRMKF